MDYKVVSQQVVDNVGGLENIEGATHCVTRLRLVLKDTSKYNKAELENIDGVKGVLYNSGQLMIIFGTGTVNKVYDEFMALTGVKEISASEVKGAEADKKGKFFSVLKVFSDIFIPIIPAFVGAAIIIGLKSLIVANGLFGMEGSLADHSEFLKNLASFFAIIATTFDYLPVLVMYSAVKRFGGNPILGILVGIVMVHPSLMNRNTFVMDPTGAEYWNFGPLSIPMVAFQGGGAIGMYLIHKKHSKERNICMSSFIPTLVGISEPAIFAANMRYSIIPFICACIGAGCGGAFVKLFEVRAIGQGLTGVLGLLIVTPETLVWYVAGNLIAFIVPIVLIFAYNKAKGVPTTDEEGAGAGFDVSF